MNVLVLVVSALLLALASAQCPSVPRTGCFQSTNVDATIRSYLLGSQVDWSWTDDNEDYGVSETLPSFTNSNPLGLFTLCVYNGNTVTQTETVAPATSGNTLYSIPAVLNLNLDVNPNSRRITLQTGGTARLWASFLSSSERSNAITQLIETNGRCWSKAISFVPSSLPPVKIGGYLDLNLTTSVLNRLAARYNARSNGQPLNMITFSAALGAADLFQRHATANLTGFNLKAHLSTFHVLGWYGGLWFYRDGFGQNRPGGNIDTLDQIDTRYSSIAELVDSQSLTAIANTIESTTLNPTAPPPGSLPTDTIGSFGYNTGYALQVIESGAALASSNNNANFLAPIGGIVCEGSHPPCSGGICTVPTNTSLLGCSFSPQRIAATSSLQSSLNTYRTNFPTQAATLLTGQNNGEPIGRAVWSILSVNIAPNPTVYQSLYVVNNAFLETLKTSGLLAMNYAIQTPGSSNALAAGTRAVISIGSGTGWLTSYNYGLRVASGALPTFELGRTPIIVT